MSESEQISQSSHLTKHQAIKQVLVEQITRGKIGVGDPIPSREHLARSQGVSVAPVRQALTELLEEGMIEALPGRRGYYVAQSKQAGSRSKLQSAALVYESARFHPELSDDKLMPQVLIDEISRIAAQRGIVIRAIPHVPVAQQGEDIELLEILSNQRVVVFFNHCYRHWIRHLEAQGCLVLEVSQPPLPGFNWINWDRNEAYLALMDHILELGHQRIGYLGLFSNDHAIVGKFFNYFQRLHEQGLPCDINLIERISQSAPMDGYHAAKRLISRLTPDQLPTALIVDTDARAIQTVTALHEAGLRVPEDISIASIDNRPQAAFCNPPLTTVGPNWGKMANAVLDIISLGMEDQLSQRINKTVPFELVKRQSTAPPRPGVL